uniref:Uncharacterized protein n=1 Tax=Fagus sylvatica TaxID=28930 RepID=A0A2N9HSH5_FAGSY
MSPPVPDIPPRASTGDISDYWLKETLVIVDYGWQFLAMCGRVFLWVIDYGLLIVDRGWQFLAERGIAVPWVVVALWGPWVVDLVYGTTTFGRASPTFVVGGNLLVVGD